MEHANECIENLHRRRILRLHSGGSMTGATFALDSLRSCPLFASCDAQTIFTVASRLRLRRFRRNEVIFHQGDAGDSLHIIATGSVKIILPSAEGEEAIIASLRPPDFFGELALLDGQPRSATATAIEFTETLALSRSMFLDLLNAHAQLRDALLSALVAELRRLTGHVEELHFLDLAGRLALRLVQLSKQNALSSNGDVTLDWPYTQSDLASMIGGTRQSVNKLLGGLIAEGLVRIERDSLVVTDVPALERRARR
jgi:CRP/FNR family cyclic AMP-dependent transcriptional regulator